MQIFIHHYQLQRLAKANSQSKNLIQNGALLKLIDDEGCFGVSDLCPWPSLGDQDLQTELSSKGPMYQRSIALAQKDLDARKNKIKLNSGQPVKNHFSVLNYTDQILTDFYGYKIKIKCDHNIQNLADFLNKESHHFDQIRLDFNGCLDFELYQRFILLLNSQAINKIECIEDPYPFNEYQWNKSIIKLASDFIVAPNWKNKISKPVRSEPDDFMYMTSAMDHPIGIAHGLIQAQKFSDMTHGFLTLSQYKETEFHKYFSVVKNEISYESNGYGIGFENELNKLNWIPVLNFDLSSENKVMYDSNLNTNDKILVYELKKYFDSQVSSKNYFLIPSSGTMSDSMHSLKIYAITVENFLNSAKRVNRHYNLKATDKWGCVLPTYHVGGLSILARAYLSKSKIYHTHWRLFSSDWLTENNVTLLSLVPTQLYDIVQKNIFCPSNLKYVFIGGAHLSEELENKATKLGWPLVVTFGMTETSSMFAAKNNSSNYYEPFQGVQIDRSVNQQLKIKCDSLAEFVIQKINNVIQIQPIQVSNWYETQDLVYIKNNKFKFENRLSEEIKIKGELVSLFKLRLQFEEILILNNLKLIDAVLMSRPDDRSGQKIVMIINKKNVEKADVIKNSFNEKVRTIEKINELFIVDEIPLAALNKIKYAELNEKLDKDTNEKV